MKRRRFESIIRADADLMHLLERLRSLGLPQWRLVAGCLYQTVWNVLTDRPRGTGIKDYDLIYYRDDASWEAEDAVIRSVAAEGAGVLLVEHNMRFVMSICEDLYVVDSGRLISAGARDVVCEDPAVISAYFGA